MSVNANPSVESQIRADIISSSSSPSSSTFDRSRRKLSNQQTQSNEPEANLAQDIRNNEIIRGSKASDDDLDFAKKSPEALVEPEFATKSSPTMIEAVRANPDQPPAENQSRVLKPRPRVSSKIAKPSDKRVMSNEKEETDLVKGGLNDSPVIRPKARDRAAVNGQREDDKWNMDNLSNIAIEVDKTRDSQCEDRIDPEDRRRNEVENGFKLGAPNQTDQMHKTSTTNLIRRDDSWQSLVSLSRVGQVQPQMSQGK